MESDRVRYAKLPGRRRGFLFGSSVWLGPDHLLLVKSARFREEYRRFYFRDIQAIVTAEAPRFHISSRSAGIAAAWGLLYLAVLGIDQATTLVSSRDLHLPWIWWGILAALAIAWVYFSAYYSCRCRIYTAVSSEDLPSVYRTWTARRFIDKVQPYLDQTQGVLGEDWAEALEDRQIGPLPEGRLPLRTLGATPVAAAAPSDGKAAGGPIAILFVGSLCLGGLAELLTLQAPANVARWILGGFVLLQLVAAVVVLVQSFTGGVRRAMRYLSIALLVSMGVWYYAVQIGAGIAIAYQRDQLKGRRAMSPQMEPMAFFSYPASRAISGGMGLLLGIAGVILLVRGERSSPEKLSFHA